jgi:hypothetical protein
MKQSTEKRQERYRAKFHEWSYAYAEDQGLIPTMPGDDHAFFYSTSAAMKDRQHLMKILSVTEQPVKALTLKTGLLGAPLTNRLDEAMSVGLVAYVNSGYTLLPKGKSFIKETLI